MAVVVDEAHCVSQWYVVIKSAPYKIVFVVVCRSKEFRTAYSRLHEIRALVPRGVPYLECTATVTRSVRLEVIQCLDMDGCHFVFTSPDRPNIYYEVHPRSDIETDMEPFVRS